MIQPWVGSRMWEVDLAKHKVGLVASLDSRVGVIY
jgi:hypothetical protein